MTEAEHDEHLRADGFRPGVPDIPAYRAAGTMDAGVCARATCEACGHEGMGYAAYSKGRRYRALAICPACGDATEF